MLTAVRRHISEVIGVRWLVAVPYLGRATRIVSTQVAIALGEYNRDFEAHLDELGCWFLVLCLYLFVEVPSEVFGGCLFVVESRDA